MITSFTSVWSRRLLRARRRDLGVEPDAGLGRRPRFAPRTILRSAALILLPTLIAGLLLPRALLPTAAAQIVSVDTAERVANNWIDLVIAKQGSWGDESTARVAETSAFRRGARVLGYHCRIEPRGYIIVSLLQQMAPVHDFGYRGDLDVDRADATADLLRDRLERRLDLIEERLGPVAEIPVATLDREIGTHHHELWEVLDRDSDRFRADLAGGGLGVDYLPGEEMCETNWHQYSPYNDYCPPILPENPCPDDDHCLVGCTGLAAAEILRHWCWPPFGVAPFDDQYAWWNMPPTINESSPWEQIDAVAELCAELGDGMDMFYCITEDGCGSYASFRMAKYAFETFFYYAECDSLLRDLYPDDAVWFGFIQEQLNLNRPIEYGIPGHAIVVDGWMEVYPGPDRYVHVLPGFPGGADEGWYLLDEILWSQGTDERMIRNIYPDCVVDNPLTGVYVSTWHPHGHWYIDRDNASDGAMFADACQVQFLPRVVVTCTNPGSGAILFYGGSPYHTRLFARGDPSRGVRLEGGGALALYGGGSMVMP